MAPGPGPGPGPPYDIQVTDEDDTSSIIAPSGQRMQASSNVQTARGEISASHEEQLRNVLVDFTMHSISQATSVPAMDVAAPSLLDTQNPPPPPFTPGHIPDQTSTWQDISLLQHELSTSTPGYGHNSCSGQNSVTSINLNQLFESVEELQISNHIASLDPAKVSSEATATSSTRFKASSSCHDAQSFEILMPPQLSECAPNAQRDTVAKQNGPDSPNSMLPSHGNPCAQNEVLYRRNQQRPRIQQITATDGQGRIYEIHQEVKRPELAEFGKRLRTFRNRTDSGALPISPEQLASAGFYLIRDDYVKCFACDQGLESWESTDDPFLEHVAYYGSTCPFVYAVMQRSRNRNTERNLSSHSTSTGFNAIFQHMIGYTWWPVLMVEEEPGKPPERTTDP